MDAPRVPSFNLATAGRSEGLTEMPVDLAHLRRYTLGDKALEDEVLGLFVAQLPETIASLRAAANQHEWKVAAHALKGSSRAVGAWRIARLAQEAEALICGAEPTARSEAISRLEAAASEARTFVMNSTARA